MYDYLWRGLQVRLPPPVQQRLGTGIREIDAYRTSYIVNRTA